MFIKEEISGITLFKSSILNESNLIHAFSTRLGGNTPAPHDSFSLGTGGMDEFLPYVKQNREELQFALGSNSKTLLIPDQKHTSNISVIKNDTDFNLKETDGIITNSNKYELMLLFADCTPVIIYDPFEKVLGVIHAGWRGTAKGIVSKAVEIFEKEFKVDAKNIIAAIGPAIGQCCYPVSTDVADQLEFTVKKNKDKLFINNNDKIRVDLKKINEQQLIEAGIINIDTMGYCTSCNNSLFYSYRADNGKTGRHCAIASIN